MGVMLIVGLLVGIIQRCDDSRLSQVKATFVKVVFSPKHSVSSYVSVVFINKMSAKEDSQPWFRIIVSRAIISTP